jgi:hypothetical protein
LIIPIARKTLGCSGLLFSEKLSMKKYLLAFLLGGIAANVTAQEDDLLKNSKTAAIIQLKCQVLLNQPV